MAAARRSDILWSTGARREPLFFLCNIRRGQDAMKSEPGQRSDDRMAQADAQLVEQTLAGDLNGYGELHRRYYDRIVNLVTGIAGDRTRAEDVVQNAWLAALEALPRLTDRDRFYPWLRRIAVNRAIEEKRRCSSRQRLHTAWHEDRGGGRTGTPGAVLNQLAGRERADEVQRALRTLPEGMRAAVVLRYFDELSMREIAGVLGCEEVTARTQVFRGLRKLGAVLGPARGEAEGSGDNP